jgi:ABC-type glycerol-3-phosphate transport system substrate-binding protein
MNRVILTAIAALSLAACTSGGAGTNTAAGADTAAVPAGGLITVNVSDIRAEIAKNINVNIENVPITVQASVQVAADVCGISVNLISVQFNAGQTTCTATTTSPELEQIVRNQMA